MKFPGGSVEIYTDTMKITTKKGDSILISGDAFDHMKEILNGNG